MGHDEAYGVLDHAWLWARNDTALRRLRALQRPFRGPGLAESPPYKVLFHPATGLCVVRRPLMPSALPLDLALPVQTLELGPCNETEAWEYNREHRLVPRDTLLRLCLRAEGVGRRCASAWAAPGAPAIRPGGSSSRTRSFTLPFTCRRRHRRARCFASTSGRTAGASSPTGASALAAAAADATRRTSGSSW